MLLNWIKKFRTSIILFATLILISIFESNKRWVEVYYSQGIYQNISSFLRRLNRLFSLSIGDLFYFLLIVYLIFTFFKFVYRIRSSTTRVAEIKQGITWAINRLVLLIIIFKLLWGINYNRQGIVNQLELKQENYTKEELVRFIEKIIDSSNFYRLQIPDTSLPILANSASFAIAEAAYLDARPFYKFLNYNNPIVKESLFSKAGNYFGFTGYYNPFTGEAQVRTDIPQIMLPFIACHEIAHQIGYASEDEANFVAFLVAAKSDNNYLKYSMFLEILDYALNDLINFSFDSDDAINNYNLRYSLVDCINPRVKKDRKTIKAFFDKNIKKMSNISSKIYDKYLKANYQKFGMQSYSKVLKLVIEYDKSKL